MGILLLGGLAFAALTDALQGRLVVGIEDFAERAFGFAVALVDELHHLDGGDQNGGDQFFERTCSCRSAWTAKPLVFRVRNNCSIVQRRR